jgi:hypothetical protein
MRIDELLMLVGNIFLITFTNWEIDKQAESLSLEEIESLQDAVISVERRSLEA